jgi:multidrug efflux pump subunit AcrA (membrane-fusion protein)
MWRNRRTVFATVAGLALAVAFAGMSGVFGRGAAVDVPTTAIVKGEFIDYLQVRGEVKAVRSIPLTVPTTGGGDLQILELAKNGMNVKKGDVVVRFDPMTVERTLNDRRSDFKQAEEEIAKTRAQYRIQQQQAQTDLTKARYDVRRAELDTVPQEFLSRMEREQKMLALADAKARLSETEEKLKSLRDIEQAELGSKLQKRDKGRFDMEHAQRQLGGLQIVSPVDGVVSIMPNWRSCCPPPDFKAGDRAIVRGPVRSSPKCRICRPCG